MDTKPKSKRGFASMTPERRSEIAAMGGKSIPSDKRYFSQNPEAAREHGRKGGFVTASRGKVGVAK